MLACQDQAKSLPTIRAIFNENKPLLILIQLIDRVWDGRGLRHVRTGVCLQTLRFTKGNVWFLLTRVRHCVTDLFRGITPGCVDRRNLTPTSHYNLME